MPRTRSFMSCLFLEIQVVIVCKPVNLCFVGVSEAAMIIKLCWYCCRCYLILCRFSGITLWSVGWSCIRDRQDTVSPLLDYNNLDSKIHGQLETIFLCFKSEFLYWLLPFSFVSFSNLAHWSNRKGKAFRPVSTRIPGIQSSCLLKWIFSVKCECRKQISLAFSYTYSLIKLLNM